MTVQDADHLQLLSIFQFVYAGLIGLVAMIGIIYVAILLTAFRGAGSPPARVGWFLIASGAAFILFGLLSVAMNVLAGLFLRRRTHRTFCMVIAAFDCLNMPLGTLLGVFTLIVLMRPGVRVAFGNPAGDRPYDYSPET